jgi:SAM-dependent methyltransferase
MTNPTGREFKQIDYGQIAEEYEVSRRVPREFKTQIIQQIIEKTELTNQTLFLELGCGTGRLIREFTKQGIPVIGIDIAPQMISQACLNPILRNNPRSHLLIGDVGALPFLFGMYHVIFAIHILHLLPDWKEVLNDIRQMLTPSGTLVFGIIEAPAYKSKLFAFYNRRRMELGYPPNDSRPTFEEIKSELSAAGASISTQTLQTTTMIPFEDTISFLDQRIFGSMRQNLPDVVHRRVMNELHEYTTTRFQSPQMQESVQITATISYAKYG